MQSNSQYIYMDHAATTPLDVSVLETIISAQEKVFGNPSSIHRTGREARSALDSARLKVAGLLGAKPSEIFFTSGGTESDNLALRGVSLAGSNSGKHIIISSVEHHAVEHTCEQLASLFGFRITRIPVDSSGMVNPDDIGRAITRETNLISIMYANNEVGTIMPISEISKIARTFNVPFHTDAVQAVGYLDLNVNRLNVDLLSLSGHKFYGPKGVGVLYVREGIAVLPSQTGGNQEGNLRAGTENVPAIAGLAKALQLSMENMEGESARLRKLRDLLIENINQKVPNSFLTGHPIQRLANNASFVFAGINGEELVRKLDLAGVAASSGSACTSCNARASHVLISMGCGNALGMGGLRLTLGKDNCEADVQKLIEVLPNIVSKLRGSDNMRTHEATKGCSGRIGLSNVVQGSPMEVISSIDELNKSIAPVGVAIQIDCPVNSQYSCCRQNASSTMVYALGQLGYDFGTEARRDYFLQQMQADISDIQELLECLQVNPHLSNSLIWTLNLDNIPIYAVRPDGPFAADAYAKMREFLNNQMENNIEHVSVPGVIEGYVSLMNRNVVPVINPELRGMFGCSTESIVNSFSEKQQISAEYVELDYEVRNFIERICYEIRSKGVSPQERAINFAATNIFQQQFVFTDALKSELKLGSINVEKSPICRTGSDCWDVRLEFFNPRKRLESSRRVYRLTVDVCDVVPTVLGKLRYWDIY